MALEDQANGKLIWNYIWLRISGICFHDSPSLPVTATLLLVVPGTEELLGVLLLPTVWTHWQWSREDLEPEAVIPFGV